MSKSTKILIVEDEVIPALVLKTKLEKEGYRVTDIISSGEKAIESVSTDLPDLIIMDIYLAGNLNGIETISRIHLQKDIPIIFITGYNDDKIEKMAMKNNPLAFFQKPLLPENVINTINEYFHPV